MGIKMNMFPGEQMTANDDGMIYNQMIPRSGILHGCEMTFMGANQIHIAKGKLMIKGRLCTVTEETIQVEMASTDVEVEGRLYVHVDLSDTQEPVKFMSVAQTPLPDLVKNEDINHENGIYEIELATYTAGRTAITNMVVTCEEIPDMGDMEKLIGSPDEYSLKKSYKKGDYCIRENTAYVANTDIPEPEEWTEAHWDETSIFGIIRELTENLQNHGKIVKLLDNLSVTTSEKTVTVDDITKYRYLVIVFGGFSCMIPPELFKIKVKNYVNTTATSSDYLVSLIATYKSDTSISYILNIGSTSNKFSLYGVM